MADVATKTEALTNSFYVAVLQCFDAVGWATGRHPACKKTEWWDAGVVMSVGQVADLHMAQLMPLPLTIFCSSKSRLVLLFWYWLTQMVLDKVQEGCKMVVCVRVCVCARVCVVVLLVESFSHCYE